MSDNDSESGFLGRWAARKAQVRAHESAELQKAPEPQDDSGQAKEDDSEPFDLASLPSLEDITAETDITAFLRREVPDFLRNAALKRAWAADPGIRDYVNPAMEYAFDWNVPGGVPGSGELEAGCDAAKQVAQMFSAPLEAKAKNEVEAPHTLVERESTEGAEEAAAEPAVPFEPASEPLRLSSSSPEKKDTEYQEDTNNNDEKAQTRADTSQLTPRRRHGGAAPA